MERAVIVLCVVVCVFVCTPVFGQVGSLCRPKERLLMCGCPKTCEDPVPNCAAVCKPGCYCEEGEVRNDQGICVKLAECPPSKSAHRRDTTEPRANNGDCPQNEEYRFCEPCPKSCEQPNPMCRAQCARGCFCKDGLLRDKDAQCVEPDQCGNRIKQNKQTTLYKMSCAEHQVYNDCETCVRTCSNPAPICPMPCSVGCFCEDGFVKAPNGTCVRLENCPKAEEMMTPFTTGLDISAHEISVEDCATDEEFFHCGWCEPSCSDPSPSCPYKVCTRGCLCKPPLLRHHSGRCVEPKDCSLRKCSDVNEDYVCQYGCERTCQRVPCHLRPQHCKLGCHCKSGLLRDLTTMRCVRPEKCIKAVPKIQLKSSYSYYLLGNYK